MEKAFLLSYRNCDKTQYKLVYALTLQEAISKLEGELDKMYIDLYGWVNIEHSICSETI